MIPAVFVFPIVPLPMLVPAVLVFDLTVFSFPIAFIVMPTLISRRHPARTRIRRPRPVPFVPLPVVAHGIPVPFDPDKVGTGSDRANAFDTRCRRRADLNAN